MSKAHRPALPKPQDTVCIAHTERGITSTCWQTPGRPYYTAEQMREYAQTAPLTDEAVWKNDAIMECNAHIGAPMNELLRLVRAVERAHGIT